jgi:hypothetical protein
LKLSSGVSKIIADAFLLQFENLDAWLKLFSHQIAICGNGWEPKCWYLLGLRKLLQGRQRT